MGFESEEEEEEEEEEEGRRKEEEEDEEEASMVSVLLQSRVFASQRFHLLLCFAIAASLLLYSSFHVRRHLPSFQPLPHDHRPSAAQTNPVITSDHDKDDRKPPDRHSDFSFIIKLLTFDRLRSLGRCLDSLAAADYAGHNVALHIFIDHFPISDEEASIHGKQKGDVSSSSSSLIDGKLKQAHEILQYVDRFIWPYGPKQIHYRSQNAGLQGQWLEAWWPASDNEFAFVVEDDMILSPLYFKYLERIIRAYYLDKFNYDPSIYGISLQRPRFVPGKHGNQLQVDNSTTLFLYQLVGTWGQLLFPRPWKEFRLWYDTHKSKNLKPFLEGMVTTGWYRRSKEKIWTPWFIKFVQSKGYFNLYTHFVNEQALSVSHRDIGVNTRKEAGPDSNLIDNESSLGMMSWEMKPAKSLKRYNYCFQEVMQWRLVKKIQDMYKVAPSLHINDTIIVVNAIGYPEIMIRNWFCQFSKFGVRNYLILLEDPMLEKDLMVRGHAVMHLDLNEFGSDKQLIDGRLNYDTAGKRIFIIAQAIMWILQAGYNAWITSVDTLWMANPLPRISVADTDMLGFADGKGISTELFYTRRSKETLSFWSSLYTDGGLHLQNGSFGQILATRALVFRSLSAGLMMDVLTYDKVHADDAESQPALHYSKAHADDAESHPTLLTGIQDSDTCVDRLKSFGFWMLDDELSCTGVYC